MICKRCFALKHVLIKVYRPKDRNYNVIKLEKFRADKKNISKFRNPVTVQCYWISAEQPNHNIITLL